MTALDLTPTIIAKSDQLNSDDLIGRSITIKITKVALLAGDQPVALSYEGDNGKPYKPGKSMRRVLSHVWGLDGNAYVGKSLTLYRDEKVIFGGAAVGGIRISHMSGITEPITMSLTASRASKKPFTVRPLGAQTSALTEIEIENAREQARNGSDHLTAWWKALGGMEQRRYMEIKDELKQIASESDEKAV